jgi:hypothetical protein
LENKLSWAFVASQDGDTAARIALRLCFIAYTPYAPVLSASRVDRTFADPVKIAGKDARARG